MSNEKLSGIYTIQQKNNNRFLDAHQQSADDFSAVTRKAQNNDTQKWLVTHISDNTYTIQQKNNNRFLDAHQQSADDFSAVTRSAQNNDTQKWILTLVGDNTYTVQQKNNSRFLDAHGQSADDFSAVTRSAQNNDTQKWIFLKDGAATATKHVEVRLMDVTCIRTEDSGPFGSNDELTIFWGGFFGKGSVKAEWRLKAIDDGEKRFFPSNKSVVFDGNLASDAPVEMIVALWDRDHGGQSNAYKKIFNDAITATATAGVVSSAASPVVGGALTGVAAVAEAINLADIANTFAGVVDPDDFLGEDKLEKSVKSLPNGKKDHILRFRNSGASYKVRIQTDVS